VRGYYVLSTTCHHAGMFPEIPEICVTYVTFPALSGLYRYVRFCTPLGWYGWKSSIPVPGPLGAAKRSIYEGPYSAPILTFAMHGPQGATKTCIYEEPMVAPILPLLYGAWPPGGQYPLTPCRISPTLRGQAQNI